MSSEKFKRSSRTTTENIPANETEPKSNLEVRKSTSQQVQRLVQEKIMDAEKSTEAEASTTSSGDLPQFLEDEGGNRGPEEIPSEVSLEARPPASEGRTGGRKKIRPRLSARMEYLARPKKDFLDEGGLERLEGSIPENALPTWGVLPLQNKLPVAWYPREITMTNLTSNLFLPPGKTFDLFDTHNRQLPVSSYSSLRDPQLKSYFKNKKMRKHLRKRGLISESGRVTTSLRDLNDYREYHRRIQAEMLQQKYRDQHEEEKRKLELQLKQKIRLAEEKIEDKRSQTLLRSYIKNAVAFIKEGSIAAQREKDLKVLNRELRLREETRNKTLAKQERYQRIYAQHMKEKYGREEWKRFTLLGMAKKDIEYCEKICIRQEQELEERKIKLEDFWSRKADEQIKWLEKGIELENKWLMDREEKIEDRKTRLQRMAARRRAEGKTLDEVLKDEEEAVSLDTILREEVKRKNSENDQRNGEIRTSSTTDLEIIEAPIQTDSQKPGESSQAELESPTKEGNTLDQSMSHPFTKATDQISEKSIDTLENDQKQGIQDILEPSDEKSTTKDLKLQGTDQKDLAEDKDSPRSVTNMGTEYQDTGNKWVDSGDDANILKQPDSFGEAVGYVGVLSEDPRRKSVKSLQKSENPNAKLESTEETLKSETKVAKHKNASRLLEPALEDRNYETELELNDSEERFADAEGSFDADEIKQQSIKNDSIGSDTIKLESVEQKYTTEDTLKSETKISKPKNASGLLEPALDERNGETEKLNESEETFTDAKDSFDADKIKQKFLENDPKE